MNHEKLNKRLLLGLPLLMLGAAGWWINRQRPQERLAGHEEIEEPAVAAAYGRIAAWPQMRLLRRMVARQALSLRQAGEAVDLGCGPGHLAVELARQAPDMQLTGIDLADEMLDTATANAQAAGLGDSLIFRKGDAARLPLEDASVDLVVSSLSLHHWSDPVAVLDEIARVLRPGGAYLIFDLRRDMPAPAYLLLWFASHVVVPGALRRAGEPLASRHAAYTAAEAGQHLATSHLAGGQVIPGPLWLFIQGHIPAG